MPGPPLELVKNIQSSDKMYTFDHSSSSRKHSHQSVILNPQQKIYQPHSPHYARVEEVTPKKRYETPIVDRNLPDVNRRGSNPTNITEYQSQTVGNTPISPRVRNQIQQNQRQSLIQQHQQQQQQQQLQYQHQQPQQQFQQQQQLALSRQKSKEQTQSGQKYPTEDVDVRRIEIGLENLGNTCFMNSTLQCLLHIQPLVEYFMEGKMDQDVNTNSPKKGMLAASFSNLVRDVFAGKSGGVIAPVNFQRAVGIFAPYLMDFQQQDSQEFLRFLLDGIAEDLCRRKPDPSQQIKSNNQQNSPPPINPSRSKSNSILPVLPQSSKSPDRGFETVSQISQGRDKLSSILKLRSETRAMRDAIEAQEDHSLPENNNSLNQSSEVPQSKLRLLKEIQRTRNSNLTSVSSSQQEPNHSDEEEGGRSESVPNSARSKSAFSQVREVFSGKPIRLRRSKLVPSDGENDASGRERRGSDSSVKTESPDDVTAIEKAAIKSWEGYLKLNDSIITDIFGGLLQSTIQCTHCSYRSHTFDPFLDLSVPISRDSESSSRGLFGTIRQAVGENKSTLEKCLEKFTGEEVLDGDNMYKCEKCKKNRKCTKRLQIYRYPKVLVIHIKRFRFNSTTREKLSTDVHFPLSGLDLRPYVSTDLQNMLALKKMPVPSNNNQADEQTPPHLQSQQRIQSQNNMTDNKEQLKTPPPELQPLTPLVPPTKNNLSDLLCNSTIAPMYDLIGVSNHHGSLNGGHYIAHVDTTYGSSKGQSPRWMCFNDARVSYANINSISGPTAYVLFYKLREENRPEIIQQ